jgi:hypothetical protein
MVDYSSAESWGSLDWSTFRDSWQGEPQARDFLQESDIPADWDAMWGVVQILVALSVSHPQFFRLPENRNRGSEVIAIHTRVGVSGSEACYHKIPAPSSLGLSQCLALLHLPPFMPQQQTV